LRSLLAKKEAVIAPGVADALGARLVAHHGFEAIYMTGAGTTAVRLGMPDVGLLTMSEMADNCARIADASGLPLIADADTGYGGVLNVRRTVERTAHGQGL
jgi:2-methylisocitrate lyase-like PEP mutase family enzyme